MKVTLAVLVILGVLVLCHSKHLENKGLREKRAAKGDGTDSGEAGDLAAPAPPQKSSRRKRETHEEDDEKENISSRTKREAEVTNDESFETEPSLDDHHRSRRSVEGEESGPELTEEDHIDN